MSSTCIRSTWTCSSRVCLLFVINSGKLLLHPHINIASNAFCYWRFFLLLRRIVEQLLYLRFHCTWHRWHVNIFVTMNPNLLLFLTKFLVAHREPNLHRTICKRCGNILKPSASAELSICDRDANMCVITCSVCGMARRFAMNSKYDLWFDNSKSVAEEIRFNDNQNWTKRMWRDERDVMKIKEFFIFFWFFL